jgi:hypothetical protein
MLPKIRFQLFGLGLGDHRAAAVWLEPMKPSDYWGRRKNSSFTLK